MPLDGIGITFVSYVRMTQCLFTGITFHTALSRLRRKEHVWGNAHFCVGEYSCSLKRKVQTSILTPSSSQQRAAELRIDSTERSGISKSHTSI